jgi:hypothetical protein
VKQAVSIHVPPVERSGARLESKLLVVDSIRAGNCKAATIEGGVLVKYWGLDGRGRRVDESWRVSEVESAFVFACQGENSVTVVGVCAPVAHTVVTIKTETELICATIVIKLKILGSRITA